ncbi:MAG TPA: lysophospholipid acyltransferase family protein [Azospirillaceae bacterium]|nr:lysophospholipid acyltransferase family protein [Azospirillaceae bacterium]
MTARVPVLGPSVPRRGGAVTRAIGKMLVRALGWRVAGNLPDLPKFIIIGAPHSSNWDFLVGIAIVFALNLRVTILAKSSLFKGPLGGLMRWLDVAPVDRSASHGLVGECVALFRNNEKMVLGITPEGTRNPGPRWKMGFYHIARQAGVPIATIALDFRNRTLHIEPPLYPTGDVDADMAELGRRYIGIEGKRRTMTDSPFLPGAGGRG